MFMGGGDRKKMASVIVASMGKPSAEKNADAYGKMAAEPEAPESDVDPGLMSAAEEAMQAIHAKDAGAFAQALKSFFSQCDSAEDDEEPEEPKSSFVG